MISVKSLEEQKAIMEQVESLDPLVKSSFINTASINALANLLVEKEILSKEDIDQKLLSIMEERIKDFK